MRLLLTTWVLLTAAPLSAQVDAAPPAFQAGPERPAEVVARMARRAMGLPEDPAAWEALAEALPELALNGGASLEETFEAARVADSLSATALSAGTANPQDEPAFTLWGVTLPTGNPLPALALAIALMGALAGLLFRRRSRATEPRPGEGQGKLVAARSLVTAGLPAHEISRRTGMAQDAVHVMLAMSGATPLPRPRTRTVSTIKGPSRDHRGSSAAAVTREELEREAREAAARLRDQRLTYGPGARA